MSEKKVKLTNGVEYKELYNSMEKNILEWEKQNLGNPYFCKFNSPVVKKLNNELFQDYIVLQEDGNVSIASPLVFLEADIKKWKNVKSVVNTVALTENGEVFSANLPFERSKANMQDSDFTDWKDVKEIYSANTPGIWGKHDIVALQKDGRIRWRENNIFKGNLVVEETSAWENVKKLYICDTDKLVLAAVDFDGNILVSGDDELKKRVSFLSSSPKKIFFTVKQDIIALYDDGHIECTFDDELSKMLNSFNTVENIFADNNEFNPNILVVQKDNANSIFYVYRDSEVEITIEKIDLDFDEICMLNDIWKSPICIEYKNQKTYYTWETTYEGRTLKPFEDMNLFKWEDLAGIAYEKSGTGKLFLKRNGALISNYDDEYINSIKNVKEAGIIKSTLIILKDNNDFEIHDYYAGTKYITIANCEKFLILNLLNPKESASAAQHIFVLHDKKLTVYTRPNSFGSVEPKLCGEYDDVTNIFMAPNGETVCVRFNNGRLKTFGEYVFDSAIDFDGAIMYYYGSLLEDGAMKLQDKYSRSDSGKDMRGEFTGIYGLQKNGKCFVLSNQNWLVDSAWYLGVKALSAMDSTNNVKDICPSKFLFVNQNNNLSSFKYAVNYNNASSFSASLYYEVCVNNQGAILGTRTAKYNCCKFDGIGLVKKALAFSMGTVVLTQDGKLKSLCNKASERAYENLPVKSGVKDILANYNLFAILCENGDLYACKRQKAVYYNSGFEQKPFTAWQLIMKGVERLELCGEETFAILGADAEIPTKQDKPTSENIKPQVTEEPAFDDFKIVKGVLKKYTGSGGDVVIPDCITKIGRDAFSDDFWGKNPSITSVIIPQGIKSVDDCAFSGCTNLIKVSIPEGVTKIGEYAFSICKSLEAVVIPNSVIKIGENAFSGCESLKEIIFPFDLTEISENAFSSCFSLVNIVIPSNVKCIGDSAFSNCKNLENVVIQEGVKKLGMSAFSLCQKLKTITIPKTVKEIDWNAFAYCENLTIHAPAGSYAEQYAKENRIPFIAE